MQWVTIKPPTKVDQSCVNGLTPGQAYDAILDTLNNDPYWFIQLCTGDIPPCGVDTWKVGTRIYNCWRMYNNGSTIEYQQCDWNSYCEQIWEICWIQGTGPQKTLIQDWTQVGTPACNNPMPPVPGAGQTSACWNEHICQ